MNSYFSLFHYFQDHYNVQSLNPTLHFVCLGYIKWSPFLYCQE